MKNKLLKLVVAATLSLVTLSVNAAGFIVDSGLGLASGGLNVDSSQWMAQQFTLNQSYELHSIEGWIGDYVPGVLTLVIYGNDSQGPTNKFLSAEFSFDERLNNWHGVNGLALNLDAGTYWAAFEVLGSSTFRGYMGGDATYQLGNFASSRDGINWNQQGNQGLGLRIAGELSSVAAVPEADTSSMILIGVGLIGFVARRRNAHKPKNSTLAKLLLI